MRSHFILNSGAAMACAVAGTTTLLNSHCAAQNFVAADNATNSAYAHGWYQGQNGGYGFGSWSFNGTDPTPGDQQTNSSSASLGPSWILFNLSSSSGLANAGRAISEPGGLQVGQTFETTIQNPTNFAGIYTYRGFDLLLTSASDNNLPGDNTAAVRLQVFEYYNPAMNWHINDIGDYSPSPAISAITTGASGMIVAFTLDSTNTYTLNMSPVSDLNSPYLTYYGTLGTNLPINYVNFRLYSTVSSGPTDAADNFEISSMTIAGFDLNIQIAGTNAILSWTTNVPGFYLESTTNLGPSAVWNTNLPLPVVINDQNVVTNPIAGIRQFFRLQQ